MTEDLGTLLAGQIGRVLTDEHWRVIRFLCDDVAARGETAAEAEPETEESP